MDGPDACRCREDARRRPAQRCHRRLRQGRAYWPKPCGGDAGFEVRALTSMNSLRENPVTGSLNAAIAQLLIPAGKLHVPIPRSRGQRCSAVAISMLNRLARTSGSGKTPFPGSPAACPGDHRTGRAGRLWIGRVPDRNLESSCKVQLVRLFCVLGVGVPQGERHMGRTDRLRAADATRQFSEAIRMRQVRDMTSPIKPVRLNRRQHQK